MRPAAPRPRRPVEKVIVPAEEPTRQSLPPLPPAVGGRGVKLSPGVLSLLGQTVEGRYVIRGVIGEGGMGAVYEAEQRPLGRKVALKVLHPSNAQKPEAVSRFQHEARVVSSIGHPNICELYDVGKLADGAPYLVMERLVGDSLADRITREGALPVEDVLETLLQILGGLGAAHRKGVVHRDVKPDNIFLARTPGSTEPIAKLLDFGISKMSSLDADMHLTRTGMVMGTPYYMAPEQARGEQLDHRVDLYAMGVILYEALTGKRPFVAPNYNALLVQILSGKPKPLRSLRPALLESFEPVVTRALQKSPDARFQSASEFHEALLKLRAEVQREARRAPKPAAPAAPAVSAHPSGVDIPVHFSPGTDSGEVRPAADRRPSPDPSRRAPTEVVRRAGSRPASPSRSPESTRRPQTPARPAAPAAPARPAAPAPLPLGPSGLPRFGDEMSRSEGSPFFTLTPSMLEVDTQADEGPAQFDDATQVAPPPVMGEVVPPPVPSDAVPPARAARKAPAAPPPPPVPLPASVAAAPAAPAQPGRTPSVPPPPGLAAPPVPPPPPVPAGPRVSAPEIPVTVSPSTVMPMVIPPPPPVASSEVGARGVSRAAMRASMAGQRPPPAAGRPAPRAPDSEQTTVSRPLAADEAEEIIRAARSRSGAPRSRPSRPVAAPREAAPREPARSPGAATVKASAVPPPPPVPRAPRSPAEARPGAPPAPPAPPAQPYPAAPARRAPAMPVFESDEPDEEPTRLFQPGQIPLPPDLEELLRKKRNEG